ncbi:MAG: hypothetical protein HOI47_21785 [Candidatus Scalindua sp.]|nr:hypothetical protein [Candidatus Scalindua sp.]
MKEDEKRIHRIESLVAEFQNLEGHPLDNALRLISALKIPSFTYRLTSCPAMSSEEEPWYNAKANELPCGYICENRAITFAEIVGYGSTKEEAKANLDDLISKHYSIKRRMASEGVLGTIDLEAFDAEHGLIDEKEKMTFSALVLYNVGLGPEFYEIPHIEAVSVDEAKVEAKKLADKKLGDGKWLEVKIKPIIS